MKVQEICAKENLENNMPVLRGWVCRKKDECSRDETSEQTLESLNTDINLIKAAKSDGYGIFLYEGTQGKKRLKDVKGELNF